MGRSKTYWVLVILGALGALVGILMMRSSDAALQTPGKVVGWTGIALLLISRIFFSRRQQRQQPKPPAPKDNLKIT